MFFHVKYIPAAYIFMFLKKGRKKKADNIPCHICTQWLVYEKNNCCKKISDVERAFSSSSHSFNITLFPKVPYI